MSSLPLERVYIRACFHLVLIVGNLTAQSTGNYRGIGSGIKINSRDVVASSSSISRPVALVPGELARRLIRKSLEKYADRIPRTTSVSVLQKALF